MVGIVAKRYIGGAIGEVVLLVLLGLVVVLCSSGRSLDFVSDSKSLLCEFLCVDTLG